MWTSSASPAILSIVISLGSCLSTPVSQAATDLPITQAKQLSQANETRRNRQIAPVMSAVHADWLTRPERDAEEQPDRLIEALSISEGATVVDLGAGVGYFTWRLAKQVGSRGRVLAVDIQQRMIDLLERNLSEKGIHNVEAILASEDNPGLPVGEVDLVLMVDVYHELQQPEKTIKHVRQSLKPDGRLVLVEYRKEDPTIPIHPLHKMTVEQARFELGLMNFQLTDLLDFLPRQHILIFKDAAQYQ
ncbi:MAG: SAM-dependent methyltransferase [Solibacterales bacterium]|nr:SAM-dependent methyltransferase [Bryobacterales bacterium]|tara:strand:- start:1179 stop:1919 length:741 start_codon:yes stop_codon:yes gene_type:complete